MAKFTPGPWTLEVVRTSIGVCHKIGPLGSSTKLHDACLYDDCYSAEPRDMQLAADAKLIAAAPELYHALVIAHRLLLQSPKSVAEPEDLDMMWAAIAKAEGVSNG